MDWDVLLIPGVTEIAENAAYKMSERYGLTFEFDDAFQEAAILLAAKHEMTRELMASGEPGLLHFRLCQDLTDLVKTEAKHRNDHESFEDYRLRILGFDEGNTEYARLCAFADCESCGASSHPSAECPGPAR
jgi:hypothetical protein